MQIYYSASEAKEKFAEVLKSVRRGDTLIVTYRGEPVAEIRPIPKDSGGPSPKEPGSMEAHLEELRRRGILRPANGPRKEFKPGPYIPGALERFLKERG